MIDPSMPTLRRRAKELQAAASRELANDQDAGALLLFYAAECALKASYMQRNNLKNSGESRAGALPARSFLHNLQRLIDALNIPRASLNVAPPKMLTRSGLPVDVSSLHQAWRYGEKINETVLICEWLNSIVEWCRRN